MLFSRKVDFVVHVVYSVALLTFEANGWRPYKIIITNQTAETYSPKCRVNATFGASEILGLNVEMLSTIRSPCMHTTLSFESDNGNYDMHVLNRTVDLCKFYKNKRYEPIVQVILKLLEDYLTHWFSSCPMNKGVYYLKNVELNVEKLPPFFPEKNGMFTSIVLDREEPLYGVKLLFQILKTFKKN